MHIIYWVIFLIRNISIENLKKLLPNINLIDIRSVEKYNDNHIANAINIPKAILIKDYQKYLRKDKVYYIYCQEGKRSINVCRLLSSLGYNVYNIVGGYENWILNN